LGGAKKQAILETKRAAIKCFLRFWIAIIQPKCKKNRQISL
jgi:hypothetical protein